jgi:hypothetical protein
VILLGKPGMKTHLKFTDCSDLFALALFILGLLTTSFYKMLQYMALKYCFIEGLKIRRGKCQAVRALRNDK